MMHDKAFFINYYAEYRFFKNSYDTDNDLFICRNYSLYKKIKKYNAVYYYKNSTGNKDLFTMCYDISQKWFHGNNKDNYKKTDISVGLMMAARMQCALSSATKEYYSLLQWLNISTNIYVSESESQTFKTIVDQLGIEHKIFKPIKDNSFPLLNSREMSEIWNYPKIHKLSGIARLIQKLFKPIFSKKYHILIPDWTYNNDFKKNKDTLFLNSINPAKGYYHVLNNDYIKKWTECIPVHIPNSILSSSSIEQMLGKKLKDHKINLSNIFVKIIQNVYQDNVKALINTIATYDELTDYYKPKIITLPGECHFAFVAICLIAKTKNIKTVLIMDGYLPFRNKWIFYKDQGKYLYDYVISFGSDHTKVLREIGYEKNNVIQYKPTLLKFLSNNSHTKYDIIIFSYNVQQNNPESRWDQKDKIMDDILSVLQDTKYSRLLIKIKGGYYDNIDYYYKSIKKYKSYFTVLDISSEPTHKVLSMGEKCIGQVSSAILESTYLNKDYYIYEPYENGKTDEMINSSESFKRSSISRNIDELKMNLINKSPSFIGSREKICDGLDLSTIDYNEPVYNII